MVKPIMMAVTGYATANLAEMDFLNELLGDEFSSTKNAIALTGFGFLIYRAIVLFKKTEREKDQAYEKNELDMKRKAWELAHDQKNANEKGLILVVKDLEQTVKDLEQTIKNFKK